MCSNLTPSILLPPPPPIYHPIFHPIWPHSITPPHIIKPGIITRTLFTLCKLTDQVFIKLPSSHYLSLAIFPPCKFYTRNMIRDFLIMMLMVIFLLTDFSSADILLVVRTCVAFYIALAVHREEFGILDFNDNYSSLLNAAGETQSLQMPPRNAVIPEARFLVRRPAPVEEIEDLCSLLQYMNLVENRPKYNTLNSPADTYSPHPIGQKSLPQLPKPLPQLPKPVFKQIKKSAVTAKLPVNRRLRFF